MADLDLSKLAELAKRGAPPVQRITHDISIRKPGPTEWFTVRPGDEWTTTIPIHAPPRIGTQRSDQTFIVTDGDALRILQEKNAVRICTVYVLQNRDEQTAYLSVIPVFLPSHEWQTENKYNSTRRECYEVAKKGFVQMANLGNETYGTTVPVVKFADPVWPTHLPTLKSYLDIAFEGHVIDSPEHPVILRLIGKM